MKVIHSEVEGVDYFKISLTSIDLDYLDLSYMICKEIEVKDNKMSFSVTKELKDESDASEER